MEITRLGHSCIKIKGKELTLLFDPYDESVGRSPVKESCDILLLSHHHSDHSTIDEVSDYQLLIEGPGEYEISGSFINGYSTFHDNKNGAERGPNTVYLVELDDLNVMHLGDLGHELKKETLEKIPNVDVLFIPVGGVYTIDAEVASKVISSLEPGIVIPMHYQDDKLNLPQKLDKLEKFLDTMGVEKPTTEKRFKITRKTDVPEETEIVVLEPLN